VVPPKVVDAPPPKIEAPAPILKPAGPEPVVGSPKAANEPPTLPGRTKPEPEAPGTGSKDKSTRPCRRSDNGECSEPESLGSFDGVSYVGMGRTKTSDSDKTVAVAGVNGCTGIFYHGQRFVTATHADADAVALQAYGGAVEAAKYGAVNTITIKAPDDAVFGTARDAVLQRFPNAKIVQQNYAESTTPGTFWTFSAKPGSEDVTSQLDRHPPGSGSGSGSGSGAE
jgi:hypothetical protein